MNTISSAMLAFLAQSNSWELDNWEVDRKVIIAVLVGVFLILLIILLIIGSVFATGSRTITIKKQVKKLAKQLDELAVQVQRLNGKQQRSAAALTRKEHAAPRTRRPAQALPEEFSLGAAAQPKRNSPGGNAWLKKHDGF